MTLGSSEYNSKFTRNIINASRTNVVIRYTLYKLMINNRRVHTRLRERVAALSNIKILVVMYKEYKNAKLCAWESGLVW